jgi:hypothetical protein
MAWLVEVGWPQLSRLNATDSPHLCEEKRLQNLASSTFFVGERGWFASDVLRWTILHRAGLVDLIGLAFQLVKPELDFV